MNKEELWDFVKKDTRTTSEIFEELRQQLQEISGGNLSEAESIEATRNLIGFCETVMGLGTKHRKMLENEEEQDNIVSEARDGFGV